MLKTRVITAIILLIAFAAALFLLPPLAFAWLFAGLALVAAWEWANLCNYRRWPLRLAYTAVIGGLLLLASEHIGLGPQRPLAAEPTRDILLVACTWWALSLLWIQTYPASVVLWGRRWTRALIGAVILVPTWVAISYLKYLPHGEWKIVLLVAIVVCADTGAYFTGRQFGRFKLAPNVSPGKTWEGLFGGLLACALLAVGVDQLVVLPAGGLPALLAAVLTAAVASVLGDLTESMLKRRRGIKDSSHLLPGHGGLLDRIDSLTAAAPVFTLALILSGWQ